MQARAVLCMISAKTMLYKVSRKPYIDMPMKSLAICGLLIHKISFKTNEKNLDALNALSENGTHLFLCLKICYKKFV